MWTGSRNVISSSDTVTASPPAWRIAASAAAVSTSRMMTPPWTLPATFASVTSIICVSVTRDPDAGFGAGSNAAIPASYVGPDTLPDMRRAMWALAFVLAAACSGEP